MEVAQISGFDYIVPLNSCVFEELHMLTCIGFNQTIYLFYIKNTAYF